tara:strand:+ start:49 stop:723 length:675 start_codon:yes stop_codon:yes gene_type:complete
MNLIKIILKKFRRLVLTDFREEQLSKYFADIISKNIKHNSINILDYGSGHYPKIIFELKKKLRILGFDTNIFCVDFYRDTELKVLNSESETISFINFNEFEKIKTEFDLAIISDVLHHIGIENLVNETNLEQVFKSKFVLIKDHFEYSLFTRYLLIFMDFIGNYKDSVRIPRKYFSYNTYLNFLQNNNLKIIDEVQNIKLYSSFYFPMNLKKIQFIHLLTQINE